METTSKFTVEGMSCIHCEKAIKAALLEFNGIRDIEIDLGEKLVIVSYDENSLNKDSIVNAIEDIGYDVTLE